MFTTLAAIAAAQGLMGAMAEHEDFESQLLLMPENLREAARNRRSEAMREAREERRHRELVEATQNRNRGPLAFLMGFIIGRA